MHSRPTSTFLRAAAPVLFAAVIAGKASGAEPADGAAEPSREQLQQQLRQLQERVRALETTTHDSATTAPATGPAAPTTSPADNAAGAVFTDAERRSHPLNAASGGVTAGYDKGFFIKSDDGNFLLKPQVQFQFRNVGTYQEEAKHKGDEDSFQDGFEVRRARFRFDGNAFSPKFTYSFVFDTNRANGAVSLLDAWGQYAFADQWAIKAGQFKESVFHERDVSGYQQLAVDRSLDDAVLGGNLTDRVQGVSLIFGGTRDNPVRVELAYHDGANSKNTNFQDGTTNWGAGARGEYKFFGNWSDYKDLTAKGGKKDLLVVGAGADYTDRKGTDVLLGTVDAQYESADKLVVYGAFHGNYTDPHEASGKPTRFDWGALGQVGYLVTRQVEVFGRYDIVQLGNGAVASGDDTFHEFTAGVNYYLGHDGQFIHRAKLTLDATYLPNGAPSDQTQAGILAGTGDEFVVRAQLQLLI